MYNLCKVTHPALGVENSLYCNFFNHREKSLVVAGANIIRVFRLVAEVSPRFSKKDDRNTSGLYYEFLAKITYECLHLIDSLIYKIY